MQDAEGPSAAPITLPVTAAASSHTWSGPADARAPELALGDGTLRVRFGGIRAETIELVALATGTRAALRLPLLRDGCDQPLPILRLGRLRGREVVWWRRSDGEGVDLRAAFAVDGGALWAWLELPMAQGAADPVQVLAPTCDQPDWTLTQAAVATGPTDPAACVVRLAPATAATLPPAAAVREAQRVFAQAHHRLAALRLALDSDAASVPDFVGDAAAALLAHWVPGRGILDADGAALPFADRRGPILACLWLGLRDAARELLAPPPDAAAMGLADACWAVALHGYWLRATLDLGPVRAHAAWLRDCGARAEIAACDGALPFATAFAAVQALAHLGALAAALEPEPADHTEGPDWSQRALQALPRFEVRHWHDGAGHYGRAAATDAEALLPVASGWLLATGDHAERNVRTVLRTLARGGDRIADRQGTEDASVPTQAALCHALASFAARERAAALSRLVSMTTATSPPIADLGLAVDAALHAITGLRLAVAPDLDRDWLRLAPILPLGARRLSCIGLEQDGCTTDLWVDRGAGEPPHLDGGTRLGANDREPRRAATAAAGWMRITVGLQRAPQPQRLLVLDALGQQVQAQLAPGGTVTHVVQPGREAALLPSR